jgi:Mg-chelatase subunit ChlD
MSEKIIDKIKKLMAIAEGKTSSSEMENEAAAAGKMARKLLLQHKIDQSVLKTAETFEPDYIPPIMGKSIVPNPFLRANAKSKVRLFWFEELAKIVAEEYFCKVKIESGDVWIYGLDMDREIAIFMLEKIAKKEFEIQQLEFNRLSKVIGATRIAIGAKKDSSAEPLPRIWLGDKQFTDSFHKGFRDALKEDFAKENKATNNTDVFEKAMKDIDAFMRNDVSYSYSRQYVESPEREIAEWDYVIRLGNKFGARMSNNMDTLAKQNASQQIAVTEKKGFVGEVYAVLDDSGSMNERSKLSQLKDGVREFASTAIANGQAVGLIKFGNDPTHLIKPQAEVNKGFIQTLNSLDGSSGGTEMIPALKSAQAYFRNSRTKKSILLVTDGQPTDLGGKEAVIQCANEIKKSGIKIITIGCGYADEEFLKRLASDSMGELVAESDLKLGMKRAALLLNS